MSNIRIPNQCPFCRVESKEHETFKYPHVGQVVLTRVAWMGIDRQGRQMLTWEAQAGKEPSRVQFPHVASFTPVDAWCPNCLTQFHIGPIHPADESEALNGQPGLLVQ